VTGTPAIDDPRSEIAQALGERVRDAASDLAHTAARLVADPAPAAGAASTAPALRACMERLTDAAGFADLHTGRDLADVTADLGISHAEARRRFNSGPPNLPLLAVLAEEFAEP
jgi:hypothetical protein